MALIKPNDSLEIVFGDTLYASVKLNADPATRTFTKKIDQERDGLEAKVKARNKATESVVRMEALADFAYEESGRKLVVFEKAVDHVHAEDPEGYAAWFPSTPARLLGTPPSRRGQAFAALVKKCKAAAQKGPLAVEAKAWLDRWHAYEEAAGALEKAEEEAAGVVEAVQQQKVRCCVAMREAHGRVEAAFAHDRARVESFFRKRKKKAAKKSAPTPTAATG